MESICFTPEYIRDYIISQLKDNRNFLFNELDLQMFVARSLESKFKNGYRVYLEYRLPKKWNKAFDDGYDMWGETPYFDIVVEDSTNKKFIAIELKYKLKAVKLGSDKSFTRFGTPSPQDEEIILVTDQSAQNEGRYDFWKDVKRLELLEECFENVSGGVAIFVTNDKTYYKTDGNFKYSQFAFKSKEAESFLYWNHDAPRCKRICLSSEHDINKCGEGKECQNCGECRNRGKIERPNFTLNKKYEGVWHVNNDKEYLNKWQNECFYCYSVLIPNPTTSQISLHDVLVVPKETLRF